VGVSRRLAALALIKLAIVLDFSKLFRTIRAEWMKIHEKNEKE
jgi:hypothetical protein